MNAILYVLIFLIGIFFGSFYTLAVYRIPKGQDIVYTHSYCPNCNHKLGLFELIPIFSYIFQRGKCKHCGEKIRIRYLVLELLSGMLFVLFAYALKLDIYNLNISNVVFFAFTALYLTAIILIAGIDKENRKVEKGVLYYGIIFSIAYIVYLYIIEEPSMYRYVIYLAILAILLVVDNITLRKFAKNSYVNSMLILVVIMAIFTGEFVTWYTVITLLMSIAIYLLINKVKNRGKRHAQDKQILNSEISLAYFLGSINIGIFLITIYCINYIL